MNIGSLRHRIIIQTFTDAQDESGFPVKTWVDSTTVWGSVEPLAERELISAQQAQSEARLRVTIRYKSTINANKRLKVGTRILEIVEVINPQEKDEKQILLCKEIT